MLVQEAHRTTRQTSEALRLAVLHKMQILDTAPEAGFDALADEAQAACAAPFGSVTLVDEKRQWFKARGRIAVCEIERELGFCTHTIKSHDPLVLGDATKDPRFQDHPMVVGGPKIRAYLGAPIICEGQAIGAVCVTDMVPRDWAQGHIDAVRRLALIAASMISLRAGQLDAANGEALLAAVIEGEARQRRIFEAISEGVILQDAAGRIVDFNPSATRILGMDEADLLGRTSFDLGWRMTDETGSALKDGERPTIRALHQGQVVEGSVACIETPTRGWRWLQVNARPLFADGPGSAVTHVAATFADVTALKDGERRILAREEQLRSLFEALPAPVYATDADGYLTFYNEAAAEFWGQRPILGASRWCGAYQLMTEDGAPLAHEQCPMAQCLKEARPVRDVIAIARRPDGSQAYFQPYPTPLLDHDGVLIGGINVLVDITRLKEVETGQSALISELESAKQAIGVALEAAQAGGRAQSAFLANMSHELRTPLNGVIGVLDALGRTQLDSRQREMLGLVADSTRSLEHILSDILDLSKIEADKLSIELTTLDLGEVVGSACELMRVRAVEKALGFQVVIGPEARGWFKGDSLRLRQVVSNLVSNAIKFTERGQVRVSVGCTAPTEEGGPATASIEVADTGRGFDEATATRLFERFEQADTSITRRHGGTGLGLPISRELVRLMGGEIAVSSAPDLGSVFRITLPLYRAEAPAVAPVSAPAGCQSPVGPADRPLRILVAEDHPTNRRVVQLMLEPTGAALTFAENGQEAVDAWVQGDFDVILMDMQMPVMDGLTAIREIRQREAARPGNLRAAVAMLSANVGDEHSAAAALAGADAYIVKPITIDSLIGGICEARERAANAILGWGIAAAG